MRDTETMTIAALLPKLFIHAAVPEEICSLEAWHTLLDLPRTLSSRYVSTSSTSDVMSFKPVDQIANSTQDTGPARVQSNGSNTSGFFTVTDKLPKRTDQRKKTGTSTSHEFQKTRPQNNKQFQKQFLLTYPTALPGTSTSHDLEKQDTKMKQIQQQCRLTSEVISHIAQGDSKHAKVQ